MAKRGPLHKRDATLVAEELAASDPEQQDQQGEVERKVAELAQTTLLGAHLGGRAGHPEASRTEIRGGGLEDILRSFDHAALVTGLAGESTRRRGRRGPELAPQLGASRHHAARHGDQQQHVDRGEPRSAVDVEQGEAIKPRSKVRMFASEVGHRSRIAGDAALGKDGAGNGRQCQEHQQDDRCPHRGEAAPRPPPPGHQLRRWRSLGVVRIGSVHLLRSTYVRLLRGHRGHTIGNSR